MSASQPLSQRLTSLDVFRGMAIAGMILVNTPGSWSHVYPPLLHAEWDGFTPTDLVFPAFLFIAGTAMAFSLSKYLGDNSPTAKVYWRIFRRCLLLFALGVFLNTLNLVLGLHDNLRILGVLQRISLAYFLAAIAILNLSKRALWLVGGAILLGYWAALMLVPVPGFGAGNWTPEGNLVGYLDRILLGTELMYKQGPFDPEGLLSTLPAVATVLTGYFAGDWIRHKSLDSSTSMDLVLLGLSSLLLGHLWGVGFPVNKQLWTSSYVLVGTGWSLLLLAACYELIEVKRVRSWGFPFKVMGMNAIFLFVASGIVTRFFYFFKVGTEEDSPSLYKWIYENLFAPWAGELNGSFLFAIAVVALWWLVLYGMYRKGWFLKI
ncbi:MAG: heparan-alpha-glucosaminide N-acetyltransferase domain-containing protein [Cyanobacteriota bacterium]|nr:heparan-alpha-glucosaminide N-acetyltransferase domain-containing protein [Cyanobacteriota bacterium]